MSVILHTFPTEIFTNLCTYNWLYFIADVKLLLKN